MDNEKLDLACGQIQALTLTLTQVISVLQPAQAAKAAAALSAQRQHLTAPQDFSTPEAQLIAQGALLNQFVELLASVGKTG